MEQRASLQRVAALAALVLLQACGGGGGDSSAPSPPSAAAPPSPPPNPPPNPPADPPAAIDITCGLANFGADALRLINARRAAGATCGARGSFAPTGPLAAQPQLTTAAYGHSRDMADNNYFSHTSPDGRTLGARVTAAGYVWTTVGENIAAGYGTVQQTIDAWMTSDGHCANLMEPRFTEFGLACASNTGSTYRTYWTLDMGRP